MAQDSAKDLTFCSQNSLKSSILENIMGYVDYGSPLLVKDKGTDSNEDTNIIFSCSFVINSRLTKTEDLSFVRQLFSALSISAWGFHKFGYCDTPVIMTKLIVAYFNFQNSHSQAWLLHFFYRQGINFFRNLLKHTERPRVSIGIFDFLTFLLFKFYYLNYQRPKKVALKNYLKKTLLWD